MSELRFDPIMKHWVVISPERGDNPQFFYINDKEFALAPRNCPFCVGNEALSAGELFRIANAKDHASWDLRVVPNNQPLLKVEETLKRTGIGMYDKISGMGAHEVIIDTPQHYLSLSGYTQDIFYNVFTAVKARINDLHKDNRIRYIHVFKNHGYGAGALMEHPHTQVVGMPVITKYLKQKLSSAKSYYVAKERCIFCDILTEESYFEKRIVAENMDFVAFVPYAAAAPFQVDIIPKQHCHDMTAISNAEQTSLAAIMAQVFKQYDLVLGNPPLNFALYTAPPKVVRPEYPYYWQSLDYDFHWHITMIPRITRIGGLELGGGMFINPVMPEKAALLLKQAGK